MKESLASVPITISVEEPRPLLDEGEYVARCSDATIAWARRWKKWISRLVLEPVNYNGRPYTGSLCKFLQLGSNPKKPHAGQQSQFHKLWVEVNGAQPNNGELTLELFIGHLFKISVQTVRADKDGKKIAAVHHYSVVREILFADALTREHLQHANTPNTDNTYNTPTQLTREPINLSTLKPSNTVNPPTHQVPSSGGRATISKKLVNQQQTSDVHRVGADTTTIESAPDSQIAPPWETPTFEVPHWDGYISRRTQ
jgi:hypothetical protein